MEMEEMRSDTKSNRDSFTKESFDRSTSNGGASFFLTENIDKKVNFQLFITNYQNSTQSSQSSVNQSGEQLKSENDFLKTRLRRFEDSF